LLQRLKLHWARAQLAREIYCFALSGELKRILQASEQGFAFRPEARYGIPRFVAEGGDVLRAPLAALDEKLEVLRLVASPERSEGCS
jgi:hypothetical protein